MNLKSDHVHKALIYCPFFNIQYMQNGTDLISLSIESYCINNIYQLLDESELNMICQWRTISYFLIPKAEANDWQRDTEQ